MLELMEVQKEEKSLHPTVSSPTSVTSIVQNIVVSDMAGGDVTVNAGLTPDLVGRFMNIIELQQQTIDRLLTLLLAKRGKLVRKQTSLPWQKS